MTFSTHHAAAASIRAHRDEILRTWEAAVGTMPRAKQLDRPALIDPIPGLLDHIARAAEALEHGPAPELPPEPIERHALVRLDQGFDLLDLIGELRALRRCIVKLFARDHQGSIDAAELEVLEDAIDAAVAGTITQYTVVRERTLQGFDRITSAALESSSLDDLLRRLLHVLRETTPAIDGAAIYLREADVLRLRVAECRGCENEGDVAMRVGDGFAGAIAARRGAMTLPHPAAEHCRENPLLARTPVRVLHGVPILDRGDVIGVATIASFTAEQFSLQDQRIVAAMIARAGVAVVQHERRDQVRRAGAQLAEPERQLRALADNVPQLVWMADPAGSCYWCNQRWYEYTGATPEDSQGWGWEKAVHPDHVPRIVELWHHAVEHGLSWEDTHPVRSADGHYRWFLSRAHPIRDASGRIERWVGTNTDVTAQRLVDDATRILNSTLDMGDALEQLAQLAVPDLADWCIVDLLEHGQLNHVATVHGDEPERAAACEVEQRLRLDLDAAGGAGRILRSGVAAVMPEIPAETLTAQACTPEHLELLRELGFKSWIGAPLVARGSTIGVLHLIMAGSNRRYCEADVELAVELGRRAGMAVDNTRLYREAQTAIRVRDDVLAIVSHDLRSPLQAMNLAATMLHQQGDTDPGARRYLEVLRRSVERMEHLINDLLDMASINAGKLAITPARISADRLVGEIVDMYEPLAAERGIRVLRDHKIGGVALHVDRDRIAQALGNLLGNAIKFCRPGDVITVRGQRVGDSLQLTIADTGPGIPALDLPHLFEAYWSGRSGKHKGAGLGLFITKAIIEAHDGHIAASSPDGAGATFVVTLPIAPAP
jgi:PAS domain S-box-containing protein